MLYQKRFVPHFDLRAGRGDSVRRSDGCNAAIRLGIREFLDPLDHRKSSLRWRGAFWCFPALASR